MQAALAGDVVAAKVQRSGELCDWCEQRDKQAKAYILDDNGTRVELDLAYYPDLPQADLDEIESIVQSVRIGPPEASETPVTAGSEPGD